MSHALRNISRFYDMQPNGIIHIGANRGQEVQSYKESGILPIVLVEPLYEPFQRLLREVAGEPGFYPIQECLSDVSGKSVEFNVASNGGQASSYYMPLKHLEYYPNVTFCSTLKFTTKTLDEIINSLPESVDRRLLDYISLDTQGSELDILKGGLNAMRHAKFIYTEVSYPGLYKDAPDIYDVIEFLRSNDFDICQLVMRNKGWGDALFVRKGVISN